MRTVSTHQVDESRLLALDRNVDLDLVRNHLAAMPTICHGGDEAGSIGQLPQRQRFHWLVAPRGTVIQTSPVHTGRCHDPAAALDHLDYQQEIALRHTRAKKNRTDNVDAVADHVPLRYLIAFIYPITATIKPFLAKKGHAEEEVEKTCTRHGLSQWYCR
jgi:hypothetical protein